MCCCKPCVGLSGKSCVWCCHIWYGALPFGMAKLCSTDWFFFLFLFSFLFLSFLKRRLCAYVNRQIVGISNALRRSSFIFLPQRVWVLGTHFNFLHQCNTLISKQGAHPYFLRGTLPLHHPWFTKWRSRGSSSTDRIACWNAAPPSSGSSHLQRTRRYGSCWCCTGHSKFFWDPMGSLIGNQEVLHISLTQGAFFFLENKKYSHF